MRIIIDADACPKAVLNICLKSGKKHSVPVWTVSSLNHNIESDHHISVDIESQETDMKIINMVIANDIVVTQDWGLASIILAKKAKCISVSGKLYDNRTIDFLLEEREMKAKHRRGGGRTKGPAKRTKEDDMFFEKNLEKLLCDSPEDSGQ